jgi:hypothetical protein
MPSDNIHYVGKYDRHVGYTWATSAVDGDDSLHATPGDIARFSGRSALSAIDAIEVHYVHRRSWYICHPCDAVAVHWVWHEYSHR